MSAETGDVAEYCLRLADDRLVLGHRLSEWCGHLPIVEEELALGNVALDLLDQATLLLNRVASLEGRGRTADGLAFFREVREFRNLLLVEQPNGDFAATVVRQFLFDVFDLALSTGLERSADAQLAAFASRSAKEATYHLRHSRQWVLRLGDGTEESHRRMQSGIDDLWRFTGELFATDDLVARLVASGIAVDPEPLRRLWQEEVGETFAQAGLAMPGDEVGMRVGGRSGRHGETLDRMLSEMQVVARSFPGGNW